MELIEGFQHLFFLIEVATTLDDLKRYCEAAHLFQHLFFLMEVATLVGHVLMALRHEYGFQHLFFLTEVATGKMSTSNGKLLMLLCFNTFSS
jgi:hypothetical protein